MPSFWKSHAHEAGVPFEENVVSMNPTVNAAGPDVVDVWNPAKIPVPVVSSAPRHGVPERGWRSMSSMTCVNAMPLNNPDDDPVM